MFNSKLFALAALSFLLAIFQLSSSEATCDYTACVFKGIPKRSDIENHILKLNISQIPKDTASQCLLLTRLGEKCEPQFAGCPTSLTQVYANRFDDPAYVHYIKTLADEICSNLDRYLALKGCFTPSLQTRLQKCIFVDGYNFPCLLKSYQNLNKCSDDMDKTFLHLVNHWFTKNPYNKRS